MEGSEVRRATEAGTATASALGLEVDEVVVVNNSDRMALRLEPCGALARVAPSAHVVATAFEVEIARRLVEVDAPVAELEPRVEARVYLRDSFAISFWTYYEPVAPPIAPSEYAGALMRQHAALRRLELTTPRFTDRVADALREVSDSDRTPGLRDVDRQLLETTLRRLGAVVSHAAVGEQLLHGEPHPGNLLATRSGPLFVDLPRAVEGRSSSTSRTRPKRSGPTTRRPTPTWCTGATSSCGPCSRRGGGARATNCRTVTTGRSRG